MSLTTSHLLSTGIFHTISCMHRIKLSGLRLQFCHLLALWFIHNELDKWQNLSHMVVRSELMHEKGLLNCVTHHEIFKQYISYTDNTQGQACHKGLFRWVWFSCWEVAIFKNWCFILSMIFNENNKEEDHSRVINSIEWFSSYSNSVIPVSIMPCTCTSEPKVDFMLQSVYLWFISRG